MKYIYKTTYFLLFLNKILQEYIEVQLSYNILNWFRISLIYWRSWILEQSSKLSDLLSDPDLKNWYRINFVRNYQQRSEFTWFEFRWSYQKPVSQNTYSSKKTQMHSHLKSVGKKALELSMIHSKQMGKQAVTF